MELTETAKEKKTSEKKNPPTKEQQAAIEAVENTVVAAGAGSGKTTVLSQRFLNLVRTKHFNVDEILTLTFTKKATVEMSDRIYKALKKDAPEQAADFFKANIKTMDSYCGGVAKLGCRFYGISPDFVMDQKTVENSVRQKALPFILKYRDNPVIKEYVQIKDYKNVAEELFVRPVLSRSKIAEPIQFRADFKKQTDEILKQWNSVIKKIDENFSWFEEFEFSGNKNTDFYKNYEKIKCEFETPEPFVLTEKIIEDGDFSKLKEYVTCVWKKNYPKPRKNTKGAEEYLEIFDGFDKKRKSLISMCNFIAGIPFSKTLIPLLEEFQEIVMEAKRNSNCLTFADVSNMALCILRDYPEIRLLEKKKYKAIMIDEFQDNNSDQRDMLFLLAEKKERMEKSVPCPSELYPDKLFFVGDEKQSIYKFRGADVEVFNNLRNDFRGGNLPMSINHRSHPALISAFNTIFGGILFPNKEIHRLDYAPSVFYSEKAENRTETEIPLFEAVYHPVEIPDYKKEDKNLAVDSPRVHLALYDAKQSDDTDETDLTGEEAEAEWVARKIQEKIDEGVNPSEIAVLMQKYNGQPLFERTFLRHGIPYNTETVTGFFSDGPVCDIIAYLRLLAYREDSVAYCQVLTSPFVNLSVLEAEAVLSLECGPFDDAAKSVLKGKSLEKFSAAKTFFDETADFCRENSLSQLITKIWYDGGYRFETMWNHAVEMYGKMYDLIFEMARKADEENQDLTAFVDSVCKYKDDSMKLDDMDIPLEKTDGVRLMSIHKSKGLEFDIVFVVNTQGGIKSESDSKPVYQSRKFGIALKAPPCEIFDDETVFCKKKDQPKSYFFDIAKDENAAMASAELRRVAYVAFTRARNELYITNGKYKPPQKKDASLKYLPGGGGNPEKIMQLLQPLVDFYSAEEKSAASPWTVEMIPVYPRNESYSSGGRKNSVEEKMKFVDGLREFNPYENSAVVKKEIIPQKYVAPSHLHGDDEETYLMNKNSGKDFSGGIFDSALKDDFPEINEIVEKHRNFELGNFGTIAHAYMRTAFNPEFEKSGDFPFSSREIAGLEENKADLEKIVSVCLKMKEKFKNSELGKAVLKSKWRKTEYVFKSRVAGKLIFGSIDLVFEDDGGTFTVVDYKTNQKIQPELYYVQLACYRQAFSKMMSVPEENIRCVLYYLRHGKSVDITEFADAVDLDAEVLSAVEK